MSKVFLPTLLILLGLVVVILWCWSHPTVFYAR